MSELRRFEGQIPKFSAKEPSPEGPFKNPFAEVGIPPEPKPPEVRLEDLARMGMGETMTAAESAAVQLYAERLMDNMAQEDPWMQEMLEKGGDIRARMVDGIARNLPKILGAMASGQIAGDAEQAIKERVLSVLAKRRGESGAREAQTQTGTTRAGRTERLVVVSEATPLSTITPESSREDKLAYLYGLIAEVEAEQPDVQAILAKGGGIINRRQSIAETMVGALTYELTQVQTDARRKETVAGRLKKMIADQAQRLEDKQQRFGKTGPAHVSL